MGQKKKEQVKGTIVETLPNATFKVKLENGEEVLAYLAGKLRFYKIKILPQDKVLIELSPYDKKRGRIIYRLK
jgi:translation initiation factor IF-1